jgi:hypothetical protein
VRRFTGLRLLTLMEIKATSSNDENWWFFVALVVWKRRYLWHNLQDSWYTIGELNV